MGERGRYVRRTLSALLLAVVLYACDRAPAAMLEEEEPTGGTFEADVGSLLGGGYERLEGAATFAVVEAPGAPPVLALRLRSVFERATPDSTVRDTSTLDLAIARAEAPGSGTYPVVDLADVAAASDAAFVACYRSAFFADGPYRSDAGTVAITASEEGLAGTFDLEVYALVPAGPDDVRRRTFPITGAFDAVPRVPDTLDAAALFRCGADDAP